MQALSQLSYGPTWRRGTLPDTRQFVKKMNELRAPKAMARANRDRFSDFPRIANVASMGGDTVPPQTANRIGCANLPSETPWRTENALMTSWMSGADQSCSRAKSPERRQQRQYFGSHVFAYRFLIVGRRRPEKKQTIQCHFPHRLGALALRSTICSSCASSPRGRLPAPMPAQHRHDARRGNAHHVLLIEPCEFFRRRRRMRIC